MTVSQHKDADCNTRSTVLVCVPQSAAATDKRHACAKVFKSGNSLAVRIPTGTKLTVGMKMALIIEIGTFLSLQPIDPADCWFAERPLNLSIGNPLS